MNFRTLGFLSLCSLIIVSQSVHAQEKKSKLVDEFATNMCSDDFRGRIDLFFASISNETDSSGRIVITPDRTMPGRSIKYEKMISAHIGFRGFDSNRITISRNPMGISSIQFWLVPRDSEFVSADSGNSLALTSTTLFDASWIASVKRREVEFGGPWGDEPCDFGLRLDQFASVLKANPNLTAHLLATSDKRFGKQTIGRALRLTVEALTREHGVAANRIKTSYAGKRKDAEMQLWMIPHNGVSPTFREDATKWE